RVVVLAAPRPTRDPRPSDHPHHARLAVDATGRAFDRWVERPIERVPLTPATHARAGAFARAGHAALQAVLRVAREDEELWLEAIRGSPLAASLTTAQARELEAALASLHTAGSPHGKIDRDHIWIDDAGAPTLRFPREPDAHADA